jgi:hypothetical protein
MKSLSFFTLFLCFSFVSIAQNNNYRSTALSFGFNGFNLSTYYGGIGGRLWISESTVLNTSFGGSISEKKYDETENYTNGLEKNKYLNIGIGIENHLDFSDDFSPYFSYRFSFGINDRYYRYPTNISDVSSEAKEKTYSYNLDLGFGIEYWILERISFSGQHLFNIRYENGHRTVGGPTRETQDVNGFALNLGTTSIILSIYF